MKYSVVLQSETGENWPFFLAKERKLIKTKPSKLNLSFMDSS